MFLEDSIRDEIENETTSETCWDWPDDNLRADCGVVGHRPLCNDRGVVGFVARFEFVVHWACLAGDERRRLGPDGHDAEHRPWPCNWPSPGLAEP